MDIARYIGLFLLKNHFCYVHGLGNLELKKKPAAYDGLNLQPPQYDVVLTPSGSIDDSLANFIAINEQTSISKASNALREFSIEAKAQLQEGKEVIIPALGKFVWANGRIQFITDPHFQHTPPAIPVAQVAKREEAPQPKQEVKEAPYNSSSVNWGKVALLGVIVLVLAAAIVLGIKYLPMGNSNEEPVAADSSVVEALDTVVTQPVLPADSAAMASADSVAASGPDTSEYKYPESMPAPAGTMQYKVVLNEYDNLARAQKREKQLTANGNKVEVISKDSNRHFVIMPMTSAVVDTAHVLDSLRKLFNPKGVSVYK